MNKMLSIFALVFGLIACSEPVKTMDYYLKNLDEARKVVEVCKNKDTITPTEKENCQNAAGALLRAPSTSGLRP
ncbi:EexN family lipoprotein [Frederiksenia canicola]